MADDKKPAVRRITGGEAYRFKPGVSGNPGGRGSNATKALRKAKELISKFSPAAVRMLISQVYDDKLPPAVRQAAAEKLIAYAIPKAAQSIELSGKDGGPIEVDQRDYAALDTAALLAECKLLGLAAPAELAPAVQVVHEGEIVK